MILHMLFAYIVVVQDDQYKFVKNVITCTLYKMYTVHHAAFMYMTMYAIKHKW